MEGLDGVFKNWFYRLHDSESSFHIINLWLHSFDGLHLSGNFYEWLTVIKSLEDSCSEGFLDILNSSGFRNSRCFIISSFGSESRLKGRLKVRDKFSLAHGVQFSHIISGNHFVVMVVVVSGGYGGDECCEFHSFDILL